MLGVATRIRLSDVRSVPMRTFHVTWLAFFLCFFGWFGLAPLMAVVRDDLGLSQTQVADSMIASVAATVLARLVIGWVCDRFGPRRTYATLLIAGAVPVMAIGLATSYEAFLLGRLAIGVIGASFVITQYHTSVMFAPSVIGTANATTAGWGNLGGGVTQIAMPLVLAAIVSFGVEPALGWRLAMIVPGVAMIACGALYLVATVDHPEGARATPKPKLTRREVVAAALDVRVWALFVVYGACFGVELTIHNVAALYFHDRFALDLPTAGLVAGAFGVMSLFARTLGGWLSDRAARGGLSRRVLVLGCALFAEGIALVSFSRLDALWLAVPVLMLFGICVHASAGATFAIVPMVNRRALGTVSGIVGAGGNVGAIAAGFLVRSEGSALGSALFHLGVAVVIAAFAVFLVRFSQTEEASAKQLAHAGGQS